MKIKGQTKCQRPEHSYGKGNSAVMAQNGLAYLITIEGAMRFWDKSRLTYRKLSPEMSSKTLIAWRRNIPYSLAVTKFIEEINAFQA